MPEAIQSPPSKRPLDEKEPEELPEKKQKRDENEGPIAFKDLARFREIRGTDQLAGAREWTRDFKAALVVDDVIYVLNSSRVKNWKTGGACNAYLCWSLATGTWLGRCSIDKRRFLWNNHMWSIGNKETAGLGGFWGQNLYFNTYRFKDDKYSLCYHSELELLEKWNNTCLATVPDETDPWVVYVLSGFCHTLHSLPEDKHRMMKFIIGKDANDELVKKSEEQLAETCDTNVHRLKEAFMHNGHLYYFVQQLFSPEYPAGTDPPLADKLWVFDLATKSFHYQTLELTAKGAPKIENDKWKPVKVGDGVRVRLNEQGSFLLDLNTWKWHEMDDGIGGGPRNLDVSNQTLSTDGTMIVAVSYLPPGVVGGRPPLQILEIAYVQPPSLRHLAMGVVQRSLIPAARTKATTQKVDSGAKLVEFVQGYPRGFKSYAAHAAEYTAARKKAMYFYTCTEEEGKERLRQLRLQREMEKEEEKRKKRQAMDDRMAAPAKMVVLAEKNAAPPKKKAASPPKPLTDVRIHVLQALPPEHPTRVNPDRSVRHPPKQDGWEDTPVTRVLRKRSTSAKPQPPKKAGKKK